MTSATSSFVADYSHADAAYAATTLLPATLPPTRDLRALIARRNVFLTRGEIAAVRLLEPIGAFVKAADQPRVDAAAAVQLVDDDNSEEEQEDASEIARGVLFELLELRLQLGAAERKAQLSAWFATTALDGVGKFGFNFASAVALASLDAVLQLSTPLPEFANGNDFLHFADLCGGPGGFSEFIMHRRQTHGAKGWGITLRGDTDFQLHNFCATAPHSNFTAHYGADESGDVTVLANADSFIELVAAQTKGKMLALVLADGVSDAHGERLLLAQLYMALALVRNHGCVLLRLTTPHGSVPSLAAAVLADCSASICLTRAPAACGEAHMSDGAYLYARNVDEPAARAAAAGVRLLLERQAAAAPTARFCFAAGASPVSSALAAYLKAHRLFVATSSVGALRRAIDALVITRGGGSVAAEFVRATATGDMQLARVALQERVAREWNLPPPPAVAVAPVAKRPATVLPPPPTVTAAAASVSVAASKPSAGSSVYNSSWQSQSSGAASKASVNLSSYLAPVAVATPAATATVAAARPVVKRPASAISTPAVEPPAKIKPDDAKSNDAAQPQQPTQQPRFKGVDLSKYKSKIVPERK